MERRAGDAAATIVGRERQTSYDIGLRYASFDPQIATPGVNAQLLAPANNELFLVQFWAVPLDEMRAEIEAMGGKIYRFLEDYTHIVRMPAGIADNVRRLNYVRWVGPFHPAYKLDELILSRFAGGFTPEEGVKRYIIEVFERDITPMPVREELAADDIGAAPVRIRGVQGTGQLMSIMALIDQMGAGAVVHNARPSQFWVEASLTDAQMLQLARRNQVHWIEPWRGPMETDMNLVRQLGGADALQTATGMTGQGVRGEAFDTELRVTHQEFTNNAPLIHSPAVWPCPPPAPTPAGP